MRIIDIDATVATASHDVYRRFRGYVDREDLSQEGHLWVALHPERILSYTGDEQAKRAWYRLYRDLVMAIELYARREKSAILGYDPDDEYFYSSALIALTLPSVVTGTYERPLSDLGASRGLSDPAEGMSWLAARTDVQKAWESASLSSLDREIVVGYYVDGYSQDELAEFFNLDQGTISRKLARSMRKLVALLGGKKPAGCPYDCECHDAPLRRRPGVKSNISGSNQIL